MEEILNYYTKSQEINYITTILNFIICLISTLLLKIFYERYSNSLIPKNSISRMLPLLSLITFLVIIVVKTSLALSLGLVGALSIIRFRTPIKEPEELVYLFLAIGLGLGFGANQTGITLIIFLGILIFTYFLNKKKNTYLDYNLSISFTENEKMNSNLLNKLLLNYCNKLQLVKLDYDDKKKLNFIYKCNFKDFNNIQNLKNEIESNVQDLEISYFEDDVVY